MSKSRGNAIALQDVIDLLGVEGYRYYSATDVIHGSDGDQLRAHGAGLQRRPNSQ